MLTHVDQSSDSPGDPENRYPGACRLSRRAIYPWHSRRRARRRRRRYRIESPHSWLPGRALSPGESPTCLVRARSAQVRTAPSVKGALPSATLNAADQQSLGARNPLPCRRGGACRTLFRRGSVQASNSRRESLHHLPNIARDPRLNGLVIGRLQDVGDIARHDPAVLGSKSARRHGRSS